MATSLREIISYIPSSVLSNLKVLEAAGNLPKTTKKLTNALKPFTSAVVFNSPTEILKELSRDGVVPSFEFLLKEHLVIDEKLNQRVLSYAESKATMHNAVLMEGSSDDLDSLTKSLRPDSIPTFSSTATLEVFVAKICVVNTEIDPNDVIRQLKELQLFTTDLAGNITYTLDSQFGKLLSDDSIILPVVPILGGTAHIETLQYFYGESTYQIQNPVIRSALQCLQKLGGNLPKTEQKLANVLKPICKVARFCKPTDVLKRFDSKLVRQKLCAVQAKTFKLSLTDMFIDATPKREPDIMRGIGRGCRRLGRTSPRPSEMGAHFQKMEKWLLMQAKRANASFLYGTQSDDEQAVKRVKEWLDRKQSTLPSAASNASGSDEPMETGSPPTTTDTDAFSTKPKLISEFLQLCVSHTKFEPAEVVERLKAMCIIAEDENGQVTYDGIPPKQLNVAEAANLFLQAEKAVVMEEQEQQGGITVGHFAGIKRGKLGRRKYKKLHFS